MKNEKSTSTETAELRRCAETRLRSKAAGENLPRTEADMRRLLHELQVHQVELEMQNEELRRAREELELSRNKYAELYDFAPVGYFTFDAHGVIREVNLAGAQLLGIERRLLANKPFTGFIADAEGREIFSNHLDIGFATTGHAEMRNQTHGKRRHGDPWPTSERSGQLSKTRTVISLPQSLTSRSASSWKRSCKKPMTNWS